jgi:hypothetical protein
LHLWSKRGGDGCPILGGERLDRKPFRDGDNREIRFYAEEQIERLAEAELPRAPKVLGYTTREEAAEKYGVGIKTQARLRREGKLRVVEKEGHSRDGRTITWVLICIEDLEDYNRRCQTSSIPANQITLGEAALALGVTTHESVSQLADRRGWHKHTGEILVEAASKGVPTRPRQGVLLDRKDIDRELARRGMTGPRAGAPFEFAGFTWFPTCLTRKKLGCHPTSLERYRDFTCHLLDGRRDGKRVKDAVKTKRPILAIYVSVPKGAHTGARWEKTWFYLGADVELALERKQGNISPKEAAARAAAILASCKAALAGTPVVTNFADLEAEGVSPIVPLAGVNRTSGTAAQAPPADTANGNSEQARSEVPPDATRTAALPAVEVPHSRITLPFHPTAFQQRILSALTGKALTADNLQNRLDVDRKRLYREGLNELMENGLVANSRRIGGYFRPDAPPPKYAPYIGETAKMKL